MPSPCALQPPPPSPELPSSVGVSVVDVRLIRAARAGMRVSCRPQAPSEACVVACGALHREARKVLCWRAGIGGVGRSGGERRKEVKYYEAQSLYKLAGSPTGPVFWPLALYGPPHDLPMTFMKAMGRPWGGPG